MAFLIFQYSQFWNVYNNCCKWETRKGKLVALWMFSLTVLLLQMKYSQNRVVVHTIVVCCRALWRRPNLVKTNSCISSKINHFALGENDLTTRSITPNFWSNYAIMRIIKRITVSKEKYQYFITPILSQICTYRQYSHIFL